MMMKKMMMMMVMMLTIVVSTSGKSKTHKEKPQVNVTISCRPTVHHSVHECHPIPVNCVRYCHCDCHRHSCKHDGKPCKKCRKKMEKVRKMHERQMRNSRFTQRY